MPLLQFPEWLPDQAAYRNPGLLVATNVIPTASGYGPVHKFRAVTDALSARPRGAISVRDSDGSVYQYAGDSTKLYRNVGGTWTDYSKGGGYATATNEQWEFIHWKGKALGVNYSDNPQQIALGATEFSDLTTDFRARHICKVRDFVVVANTSDSTDGAVEHRVRWCAFGDETDWTVDPATLADYNDLRVGSVERLFGGQYGVILQRDSVQRMDFTGNDTVFDFNEVLPGLGAIAPGAAAQDGEVIYFLSRRGMIAMTNGSSIDLIGANKIDATVLRDIDENYLHRVSAICDPRSHRFIMAYAGAGNENGRPNRVLVYDRSLDKFALIEDQVELVWRAAGIGYTLDDLDNIAGSIDNLGISLDSPAWVGAAQSFAAFDSTFKSGHYDDEEAMIGRLQFGDLEFNEGRHSPLKAFRGMIEGGTVRARVGVRDDLESPVSWGNWLSKQNRSGLFKTKRGHRKGRYHSIDVELSEGWQHAVGIQIERDQTPAGGRIG